MALFVRPKRQDPTRQLPLEGWAHQGCSVAAVSGASDNGPVTCALGTPQGFESLEEWSATGRNDSVDTWQANDSKSQ